MNNTHYTEPEFNIVYSCIQDILTTSGGEDFNTLGDKSDKVNYINSNWTIEL